MIYLKLRQAGEIVNHKRVERMYAEAGLRVLGRLDTRPRHGRPMDATDPLHAARAAEVTSLWRLGAA